MAVWSVVLKSKLEGCTRLDPEYYQPFYLQISSSLEKQNYVELGSVAGETHLNYLDRILY
ncbi:hypothetical protein [Dolichospermum compactum]|uniref:hypothetical protein n=1 Tax=Dolichospermum compactum TaxID=136073 RepID=UPI0012FDD6E9|nr:hypothetical protein [Dolichospermum compactum]